MNVMRKKSGAAENAASSRYVKGMLCMAVAAAALSFSAEVQACTGITLKSSSGDVVVARTIEWGGSALNSSYVVVPRGHVSVSYTPDGQNGMRFSAKYGFVGLAVEQPEFVAEGLNEKGLSAGLFYFPGYGSYSVYSAADSLRSVCDLQVVSWMLSSFSTVDEVIGAIGSIDVVPLSPQTQTVHWRIADASGRQVVLEIVGGKPHFYENRIGVLTNSPGFEWQMVNLNNYVNLYAGSAPVSSLGDVKLASFGAGSGFLGMPGDVTPPSRFVRAAFYAATAPVYETGEETVLQCFHILNNFDIPIGVEFPKDRIPEGVPSATQWTSVTDITGRCIYYRTMWNSTVRKIDVGSIDFSKVKYRDEPLDRVKKEYIETIRIR